MVLAEFLQRLERDQVGKGKCGDFVDETVPLPTAEQLLGNSQHAAHVLTRILFFRRRIEHAKILACAHEKKKQNAVGLITRIWPDGSSCVHLQRVTIEESQG